VTGQTAAPAEEQQLVLVLVMVTENQENFNAHA